MRYLELVSERGMDVPSMRPAGVSPVASNSRQGPDAPATHGQDAHATGRAILWIAALAFIGGLAGCTTKEAPLSPECDPYLSQGRVQFEDHSTDAIVKIVRVDTDRVGSGLLKVVVTCRNTTQSNLFAEFRTTFLDEKRHVLEQTNWEPIELNAATVTEYTCTSMSPKAADYQIIIRRPDKTSFHQP